ncbi:hypothetical protein PsorP6_016699 [Peronosclerospora sorghi]|uniref:Uncharacterized protein n=1 Tax=Peronosclerospora sorghi TaxID=230839 RepID=A0ACC0WE49_9STRA|nr:hypothetical protein PsorP6_016699 [Peronosclerospora sorghi]
MNKQVVEEFAGLQQTLTAVEEILSVVQRTSLEDFMAQHSPLECAKIQVSLAYTINALLFIFLKTQGASSKDIRQTHVKQELERVKAFLQKIKDAEELVKGPKLVLDKDASKRFVESALSADQVYVDAVQTSDENMASKDKQPQAGNKRNVAISKSSVKKTSGSENTRLLHHN